MIALLSFFLILLVSPLKSKSRLEAENAALRHQLIVLRRKVRGGLQLTNGDRLFLIQLYRWFPSVLKSITIIRPETLVRWHRAGFRRYWRWKSGSLGGRPKIDGELRALIRRMSVDNPLWGAPRNPAKQLPSMVHKICAICYPRAAVRAVTWICGSHRTHEFFHVHGQIMGGALRNVPQLCDVRLDR